MELVQAVVGMVVTGLVGVGVGLAAFRFINFERRQDRRDDRKG